ncbi:MAG: AAA family ATPase [Propionibacteriaceae bacterium]|jgi:predicted AAA+ superfamily ATPase|nr:AAA family ATPase [Propionibacteriaceae bacterium]
MLQRKAWERLVQWKERTAPTGLLITGARQVGKTFLVQEFAKKHYSSFVEINLVENRKAAGIFDQAQDAADLFARISLTAGAELIPGETLIFIDEVQVAKEVVTGVKFLVQQHDYDFILSGSMLGVELRDVRSVPVGYLDVVEMFPMDFEEFAWANGVSQQLFADAVAAARQREPVPEYLHERLLELFHKYLIVGGMPAAVDEFTRTSNLQQVRRIQENIIQLNRWDISQYAKRDALAIKEIYDLIPSELNQQNKRFVLKNLNRHGRFNRYEEKFVWLADAGVALPVYNVTEPTYPLKLSSQSNLFKLFMADVGLLTSTFIKDVSERILAKHPDINYGSIYENAVATEFAAQGRSLYFYRNKRLGEVDFIIEKDDGTVIPIEVKSGKTYDRHVAINNLLTSPDYRIPEGIVLAEANVTTHDKVTYLPIYLAGSL